MGCRVHVNTQKLVSEILKGYTSKEPNQSNTEQRKVVEPIHQVSASFISNHTEIGTEF